MFLRCENISPLGPKRRCQCAKTRPRGGGGAWARRGLQSPPALCCGVLPKKKSPKAVRWTQPGQVEHPPGDVCPCPETTPFPAGGALAPTLHPGLCRENPAQHPQRHAAIARGKTKGTVSSGCRPTSYPGFPGSPVSWLAPRHRPGGSRGQGAGVSR